MQQPQYRRCNPIPRTETSSRTRRRGHRLWNFVTSIVAHLVFMTRWRVCDKCNSIAKTPFVILNHHHAWFCHHHGWTLKLHHEYRTSSLPRCHCNSITKTNSIIVILTLYLNVTSSVSRTPLCHLSSQWKKCYKNWSHLEKKYHTLSWIILNVARHFALQFRTMLKLLTGIFLIKLCSSTVMRSKRPFDAKKNIKAWALGLMIYSDPNGGHFADFFSYVRLSSPKKIV
jgi:hypothetical protein